MKHLPLPLAATILIAGLAPQAQADDYAAMLQYLATTTISDNVLSGAQGVIGVNMAAGDHNLQANDRLIVSSPSGIGVMESRQSIKNVSGTVPDVATARIEGNALAGAGGVVSINQASGVANIERNAVAIAPIVIQREWASLADIHADSGASSKTHPAGPSKSIRSVAVEETALQGFEGVVQLNQIAGSGNLTGNTVIMSVSPALR
ncbi:MAG: hypothetical protein AB1344_07415 [Pseudomonadota bacterium]